MLFLLLLVSACVGVKEEIKDGGATDTSVDAGADESEGSLFQGAARRR